MRFKIKDGLLALAAALALCLAFMAAGVLVLSIVLLLVGLACLGLLTLSLMRRVQKPGDDPTG